MSKSLGNTDTNTAKSNVPDIVVWGNGDMFKLLSKASSKNEGWMKSTKAMEIENTGCLVQLTTQQRNPDGSYSCAEVLTYVPFCKIAETTDEDGKVIARKLVPLGIDNIEIDENTMFID